MRIEYDSGLLEESVFRALHAGDSATKALAVEYHRRAEPLYCMFAGRAREQAFQQLQADMFVKLGLERHIDGVFAFFPRLIKDVERAVFIPALQRKEEEAELFGGGELPYSIVTRLTINSPIRPDAFAAFALHEFSHIDDMLNPAFAYTRTPRFGGSNRVQQDIVRNRFRELWDILIDARLTRSRRPAAQDESRHRHQFTTLFGYSELTQQVFGKLWNFEFPAPPTHRALLAAADGPQALCQLVGIEHVIQEAEVRTFANLCPICNCATMHWAPNAAQLSSSVIGRIQSRKPEWTPEKGFCGQCSEFFRTDLPVLESVGAAVSSRAEG